MALVNPNIEGPLSELTSPYGIRVTNQRPNATVSIYTTTPSKTLVAEGPVRSSDERIPMVSGISLKSNMKLYAMQEADGLKSLEPTDGDQFVGVQPQPTRLGSVAFKSHIYECGQFVWITGAVPGATVEVVWTNPSGGGERALGRGPCLEGDARFRLDPIPHDGSVRARQLIDGGLQGPFGPAINPDAIPLHGNQRGLPPPSVKNPSRGCDASIDISGVYDGALVTLQPDGMATLQAGFELSDMWFILPEPLKEGQSFTLKQEVSEKCERFGIPSDPPISVGPLGPVDPPVVKAPLCAGSTRVVISNLRRGANVEIHNNGRVFGGTNRPDRTEDTFIVPPLEAGTVFALQVQCDVASHPSEEVPVDVHPEHIQPCTIVPRLYDCARNVSVNNIHPPSTLEVCVVNNGNLDPISKPITTYDTQAVIEVSPYLNYKDDIVIRQWACSDKSITSDPVSVESYPGLPNPIVVGPVFPGDRVVEISKVVPGAGIELWVIPTQGQGPRRVVSPPGLEANNLFTLTLSSVSLDLQAGDLLGAKQYLCTQASIDMPLFSVQEAGLPRPFYAIGHNPDTIQDAVEALSMGANALGPDVNVFDDGRLSISHGGGGGGDPDLISYLKDMNTLAGEWPSLSLIIFDCKSPSHSADNGLKLLTAIRQYLTNDFPLLSIVISIPSLSGTVMFQKIANILRPREGLMVDEEDDAGSVYSYFSHQGISNASYGNGNSVVNIPFFNPAVRPSIEWACGLKAGEQNSAFKFVYAWTVNNETRQREWLRIGVDGIMSGISEPIGEAGLHKLLRVMQEAEFTPYLRLATREDNAMKLPNAAYEVIFHTGTDSDAGTDSIISFALKGPSGVNSDLWSVDANLQGKFETNVFDHVTYPSGDLGDLKSITVWKTGGSFISAPNWKWERATVRSNRWKVLQKIAVVNQEVDDTAPVTGVFA